MTVESRGISPSRWGPCAWGLIHYVALAYPKRPTRRHREQYRAFVHSLQHVLPCEKCRLNMTRHLQCGTLDVALASGKDAFFDWTVRLHNAVNKECGRFQYDPQVARLLYDKGYGCRRGHGVWSWVAAFAVVAAIVVIYRSILSRLAVPR